MAAEFTKEIEKTLAVLSENSNGWTTELNIVSWNNREPVYDIRSWSPDKEKCSKGVTLNAEELQELKEFLATYEVE